MNLRPLFQYRQIFCLLPCQNINELHVLPIALSAAGQKKKSLVQKIYVQSKWENVWWEEKELAKWLVSVQDISEGRVKWVKFMELQEMEKLSCKKEEFVMWLLQKVVWTQVTPEIW